MHEPPRGPSPAPVPVPPSIDGYRPVALLGSGAMASVWMAAREQLADGLPPWCALKVIHPYVASEESVQGRFEREAQVALRLRHRNIAGVHRAGNLGRLLYLDMELVGGVSLGALCAQLRALDMPVEDGLLWSVNDGVLRGLGYAHALVDDDGRSLGIVHRDLSPSNVLVGYDGVTRIIDFGMARAYLGAFQTVLGTIGGTPRYMSPEQARGRRVDCRSDLYAWAVVLTEMLTGKSVVKLGSVPATLNSVLHDPAPRLTDLRTDLPPALDGLFASMLAKVPKARPASVEPVRASFHEVLGGGPIDDAPADAWSEEDVGALVRNVFAERYDTFERLRCPTTRFVEPAIDLQTYLGMTATTLRQAPAGDASASSLQDETPVRGSDVTTPHTRF